MKVFVSGSKNVNFIGEEAECIIRDYAEQGAEFLVGDCYGVDSVVQKFLAELGCTVTVYHMGKRPRNLLGNFKTVEVMSNATGYYWYQAKDIAMSDAADVGIAIWDGISRGTKANIQRMDSQGKKVIVIRQ
jgi:hypothetical protein